MTDNNAELGQTPSVQPVPPTTAQHAARTHQPAHPAQPQTDAQFAPQPIRAAAPAAAAPAPEPMPIVRDGRLTSESVLYEIRRVIVGQDQMLERILVALLAGGHLLLEGVPGLAKTLTIKTLADVLDASFKRIQFTPDLVPADLVGTRIYRPDRHTFDTELGPVFANFLLADEINRAPAKVQSALLEVMQERQVTIGPESFAVPRPFLVMATQNPIESEGTYPLPEAQVDRFMMKVVVGYPTAREESRRRRALAPAGARGPADPHRRQPRRAPGDDHRRLRRPARSSTTRSR